MTFERKNLGRVGEEEATSYLKKAGHKILARNYKTKFGELDIVASKNGAIVFVEVKTRIKNFHEVELRENIMNEAMNEVGPRSLGIDKGAYLPEDNIDWRKKRKLRKLGELYLDKNNYPENQEWQIDVVAVEMNEDGKVLEIRHTKQAVTN